MTRIAAIQMASGSNVQGNLTEAERLINESAANGASLVVLPENFSHMGMQETDKLDLSEAMGEGPIQNFLAEQAARHKIWLVAGTVPIKTNNAQRVYAACLVYNNEGEFVTRYDKYHLFDVEIADTHEQYLESETIKAGDELVWFDSPLGRVGLAICYDLRFPELFRHLMQHEIDIFVVPSAFTATTGAAHWESLIRSRAIENLSYVVAANQGGYHVSGRETYGDSMIVDPWGTILDRLASGPGFVQADVDLNQMRLLRSTFPALAHRRMTCGIKNDG